MTTPPALAAWHHAVQHRDRAALGRLLADDGVVHSPVLHTSQRGKAITLQYGAGAMQVLGSAHLRYERKIVGSHDALLAFSTRIDGIQINGIDLMRWDDAGQIVDFKVMVRPLKAVNLLRLLMGQMLERLKSGPPGRAPA